ncbi:MAG: type I restriction enzyme HsdR N-terminal domain-containing protein [Prevotella sp.]|nr:type I restriction enzyme HsdR N-terminal domain-containing protein [Prevotella sp.]
MTMLNLPPYDVRLGGTKERPTIFDILRRRYVKLTPEEWVRQHFVHFLINEKGYPQTLLANEVKLQMGDKSMRADSVLYDRELHPRLIVEYKAPTIEITQRVFEQISAYNLLLHVDFLIVSNGMQHYCCRMNYEQNTYEFLTEIPNYYQINL